MSQRHIVSSARLIHIDLDDAEASRSVENTLRPQQKSVRVKGSIEKIDSAIRVNGLNMFIISLGNNSCHIIDDYMSFIRHHSIFSIRFSPVIIFTYNPVHSRIQHLLKVGVDDIIIEKMDFESFLKRLENLIKHPADYYETDDYFGPDRRRNLLDGSDEAKQRRGQGEPRCRMSVKRDMDGCTVLPASYQSNSALMREMSAYLIEQS